jgi:hypothetical protein
MTKKDAVPIGAMGFVIHSTFNSKNTNFLFNYVFAERKRLCEP